MDIKSTTGKLLKGDISGVVSDVKYQIERSLSLIGVIIVTVAASIGSGLFVLPSFAAAVMGPGIWLAFLIAGIVFLPGTLSKSELASAMPDNGGAYVYVERSFGPLVGTISGLGLWASFLLKSAFALIGFSAYMYAVTNHLNVSTNTNCYNYGRLGLDYYSQYFWNQESKSIPNSNPSTNYRSNTDNLCNSVV